MKHLIGYCLIGNNWANGLVERGSELHYKREEAEKILKNITFNNWRDIPEGYSKEDIEKHLRLMNYRIAEVYAED